MTYQEFKQNIIQAVSESLGPAYRIALQDIIKNNDTHLDGLTILSANSNVSPTIYLNHYYEQYLAGRSLPFICADILRSYHDNIPKGNIDISFFTDFSKARDHIIFKLVNYERNRELLADVPHIRYLDLAMVFNCYVDTAPDGYATILIHHHHLSFWNISAGELYALAMENTPRLLNYQIQNMADVIIDLVSEKCSELAKEDLTTVPVPMYVLSNHTKLNGSGCILYKNLLSDFSARIDSDFYILPSSIHEVLLIPVEIGSSTEELTSMVREINATHLAHEEILSDHVYLYSRHTDKITM